MDKLQAAAIAATTCTLCAGGGYAIHYATSSHEEVKQPEPKKPIQVPTEKGCTLFFFKFCEPNLPYDPKDKNFKPLPENLRAKPTEESIRKAEESMRKRHEKWKKEGKIISYSTKHKEK